LNEWKKGKKNGTLSVYAQLRQKKFNDAGVNIPYNNGRDGETEEEATNYSFKIAKALGASE
jgi:hypothetical protein